MGCDIGNNLDLKEMPNDIMSGKYEFFDKDGKAIGPIEAIGLADKKDIFYRIKTVKRQFIVNNWFKNDDGFYVKVICWKGEYYFIFDPPTAKIISVENKWFVGRKYLKLEQESENEKN